MNPLQGTREPARPSTDKIVWTAILVCVTCYLGAAIGSSLRFPRIGTAIVFPPYAILTVALLHSPPRRWWIYCLAATVGNFWPHRSGGAEISFVLLAEVANHGRAMVAAYGIRRFRGADRRFDTLRGMSVLLLFAVFVAPVTAAFIGAGIVKAHNSAADFWLAWRAWLASNTLTGLTLLPIILISLAPTGSRTRQDRWRLLEAGVFALALFVVGAFVLLGPNAGSRLPAPLYAPLPLLLWAAVRFGPRGTSASLLVVGVLAIWGTLDGRGPFVSPSPEGDLIHLQLFLLVISVPLLLLSALMQEQHRTADALRASQQQYRTVVEDQTELICRFRPDGTLTFVNGACCRSWQRSAAELLGTSFWSPLPARRLDANKNSVAYLSPDHPVATWEYELVSSEKPSRWEQWRVRAFFDDRHHISDFQAVGRDITERKQAEEQQRLLDAQRALAEALREDDRRKDEFLATLAHELRNPLAPIALVVDTMRLKPSGDEDVRRGREIIGRQVTQLTRLVDDLLDVSRITCGTIQVQMKTTDLADVIANAIETSGPALTSRKIKLTTDLPSVHPLVRGDAVRLTQLVSNLLNNAAKYTDVGGRIALTVAQDDTEVVLRLADTGVGIPQNMLHRVFEPFAQVDRSRDRALGGLGLGLNLVKRLVQLHGGTVEAKSDGPGLGSEFVIRLPALQASASSRPVLPQLDAWPAITSRHVDAPNRSG